MRSTTTKPSGLTFGSNGTTIELRATTTLLITVLLTNTGSKQT